MSDERYYPSFLNEAEHLREQMRQKEMLESITRARSSMPSERGDSIGKRFSEGDRECGVLASSEAFLLREMAEIEREHSRAPYHKMFAKRTILKDDLFYTFVDIPGQDFEEGCWVEIWAGEFCQFGSLWVSERNGFYVITEKPISPGYARIRRADAYQLILMQKQAFDLLLRGSTSFALKLKKIICDKLIGPEKPVDVTFCNERLNSSQKSAVRKALGVCGINPFFLIHGPPGTGKTTVITEVVNQLVDRGKKVLITSHTNVAVDNVIENLYPFWKTHIARLGPRIKVSKMLRDTVPTTSDELVQLKTAKIVGATLSKASILVMTGKLSWSDPFFDVVIVDESSMATIPLTLVGILLGKTFLLVGDHFQLPPITKTEPPHDCQSLFQFLIEKYPQKSEFLNVQYRSHPEIIEFSSRYFYERKSGRRIESHECCANHKICIGKRVQEHIPNTIDEKPLICLETSRIADNSPIGWFPKNAPNKLPSYFNEYEAAVALAIRHDLIAAGLSSDQVCIITPYRLQRQIIREAVRGIYGSVQDYDVVGLEDLTASTVDSIQGKERDVIIYCTTWVPETERKRDDINVALRDWRKLNVALTRARKKLVIVGSISRLYSYPFGPLYRFLRERNNVILALKMMQNDDFLTVLKYYYGKKASEHGIVQDSFVKSIIQKLRGEAAAKQAPLSIPVSKPSEYSRERTQFSSKPIISVKKKLGAYVPLISQKDFEEYGKVKKYLKDHPEADNKEIAIKTGLHMTRVTELRSRIESDESGEKVHPEKRDLEKVDRSVVRPSQLSSIQKEDSVNQSDADFRSSIAVKKEDEHALDLVQCPHCISRVRRDRLGRHIERVHGSASQSDSTHYSGVTKPIWFTRSNTENRRCSCGALVRRVPIPDMRDGARGVICSCTRCGCTWREGSG